MTEPKTSQRAREMLAAEFREDHPQWGPIRQRILDGSAGIHSDPVSAMAAAAIRAIDKALNLSRTSTTDDALAERAAIVAWLREQAGDCNGPVQKRNLSFQIAAHNLANAIESGSHLTRGG